MSISIEEHGSDTEILGQPDYQSTYCSLPFGDAENNFIPTTMILEQQVYTPPERQHLGMALTPPAVMPVTPHLRMSEGFEPITTHSPRRMPRTSPCPPHVIIPAMTPAQHPLSPLRATPVVPYRIQTQFAVTPNQLHTPIMEHPACFTPMSPPNPITPAQALFWDHIPSSFQVNPPETPDCHFGFVAPPTPVSIPPPTVQSTPVTFRSFSNFGPRRTFRRRSRRTTRSPTPEKKKEDEALHQWRHVECRPWAEVLYLYQTTFDKPQAKKEKLEMQLLRYKESMMKWSEIDVQALQCAHKWVTENVFQIIADKLPEFGASEKWKPEQCRKKILQLQDTAPTDPFIYTNPALDCQTMSPLYQTPSLPTSPVEDLVRGFNSLQAPFHYTPAAMP